jgi:hypothetical protein
MKIKCDLSHKTETVIPEWKFCHRTPDAAAVVCQEKTFGKKCRGKKCIWWEW